MKQKNLSFSNIDTEFKNYWKNENRVQHGGLYSMGKRKTRRPLSTKKPIHIVMRSEVAKGAMSLRLPNNKYQATQLIRKYSNRFNISIYKYSINSNHLHLILRTKTRKTVQDFLRTLGGQIARFILKAERGRRKGRFWRHLSFSRISEWGKAYENLKAYVVQNILEAAGVIEYKPRKGMVKEHGIIRHEWEDMKKS